MATTVSSGTSAPGGAAGMGSGASGNGSSGNGSSGNGSSSSGPPGNGAMAGGGSAAATAPGPSGATAYYEAQLTPANDSGASGVALVSRQANTVTVTVNATGLVPDQTHMMHIHGFPDDQRSVAPTPANDTNHDGYIDLNEAQAVAGPPLLSLAANPQTAIQPVGSTTGDVFPTADANGNLTYHESFNFSGVQGSLLLTALEPLGIRLVEIHGMNVPAGALGTSGGYQPTLPASGALLHQIPTATGEVLTELLNGAPLSHVTLG